MLADFACLCAQCTDVPVYPTLPTAQIEYILRDSGAVAAFCSTADQVGKLIAVQGSLPTLRHLIVFDPKAKRGQVMSLAELEQRGRAAEGKYPTFRQDSLAVQPQDLATLIYTSGTTGEPKGVMLSHANICSNIDAALQVVPVASQDECLAMLPLAHIFERMVDYAFFNAGVILNYAESFEAVPTNLGEVRPTIVVAVPRLFEKVYARVLENALSGSGLKRRIFLWSKRTGEECVSYALSGLPVPAALRVKRALADRLGVSKLRARTGLGGIRTRGGVPRPPHDPRRSREARQRRQGHSRCAAQDRGGRRDPRQGAERDARLLQQARGHAGSDRRRRLVSHRGHRRARRRGLPEDHGPQEGPDQDRGWQVRRPAADREPGEAEQVRGQRRGARR